MNKKKIEKMFRELFNSSTPSMSDDYVCEIGKIIQIVSEPTKLFAVVYLHELGGGIAGVGAVEAIKTANDYDFNETDLRYLDANALVGAKNIDKISIKGIKFEDMMK